MNYEVQLINYVGEGQIFAFLTIPIDNLCIVEGDSEKGLEFYSFYHFPF